MRVAGGITESSHPHVPSIPTITIVTLQVSEAKQYEVEHRCEHVAQTHGGLAAACLEWAGCSICFKSSRLAASEVRGAKVHS